MCDGLGAAGLTIDGCQLRQQRLREVLQHRDLPAALICDRRYVHYFTGYWQRSVFAPLALLTRQRAALLSTPLPVETEIAADEIIVYEATRLGTLVEDQFAAALRPVADRLAGSRRIGCDGPVSPWLLADVSLDSLADELSAMRRAKDPDEIDLLRRAIGGAEAAYATLSRHCSRA